MPSRRPSPSFAVWIVAIAPALLTTSPVSAFVGGDGKGDAATDCLIGLDGIEPADLTDFKRGKAVRCTDCDPACDRDGVASPNGSCTFALSVCLNQAEPAGCEPRELRKVKVKPKKAGLVAPAPAGATAVCGSPRDVVVTTRRKGRKPGKRKIRLLAKPEGRGKDKDAFLFVCDPRPEGEACSASGTTTTTTVSGTTTSTTLLGCPTSSLTFRVESSAGSAQEGAAWPGGTDTQSLGADCAVTVARPTGAVDGDGDAFQVVGFTGYTSCFGAGGADDDGCSVTACPGAEVGSCDGGRPRCPAALDGSGEATFRVRCNGPDWSPSGYVENLLVKEKMGEWTRGEGLVATLQLLAGEIDPAAVLGGAQLVRPEGTGILTMASRYLDEGPDAEARAEIARLLGKIVFTSEQLEAMAGIAPAASAAPAVRASAATVEENCASFFEGAGGIPPGVGKCLLHETFTIDGKQYRIFKPDPSLPQAGWTTDHYGWAKETVVDSLAEYNVIDPAIHAPAIDIVFAVRPAADAAWTVQGADPCPISIFTTIGTEEASFKQVLAHEVAHCYQAAAFPDQVGVAEDALWHMEGFAEYLSNVVYKETNAEYQYLETLQQRELATTLLERDYDNFIFFQYLGNTIGNLGIVRVLQSLPATGGRAGQAMGLASYDGMPEIYHDFVKALSDRAVLDASGAVVPYEIGAANTSVFTITAPRPIEKDLDAFGMLRYRISIDPDHQADMISFEQGAVLASARPRGGSDWGEVPVTLPDHCFDSVVVATSSQPSGRFDLAIEELQDAPGQCVLEGTWVVDNASLDIMVTGYDTDYVSGEIRGTFNADGTLEVVYDDFEFRTSDTDLLSVGGIEIERYESFTQTTNASGTTGYEIDGDEIKFEHFFESNFLEGVETLHHLRINDPPDAIGPGVDETFVRNPTGEYVFVGRKQYELGGGTLRLIDIGDHAITLHRAAD
jgi:hypothetical protein